MKTIAYKDRAGGRLLAYRPNEIDRIRHEDHTTRIIKALAELRHGGRMKILKRWKGNPAQLQAEGEPVGWFETTEAECIQHTEESGYWKPGSVLNILAEGGEVFTPTAYWKAA